MIPRDDRDRRPPAPDAPFAGSTESASGADREETATHMFDLPEQAVESLAERVPSLDDRIEAHDVRLSRLEECIADLQETLQRRIWAAESAGKSAAAAAEVRLAARIDGLAERQERAEPILEAAERRAAAAETGARKTRMEHATYHDAWNAAPLTARIRFVRELLAETHTLQPVLKEVAALEDLRRRGAELETWLTNYPSLFADAVQAIDAGQAQRSEAHEPANPVEALAGRTVSDARIALDAALQALGVTWVDPAPGDAVTSEHEVVADEPADAPAGSVAQLRRRGFRIRGRLVVPAQVERAIAKPAAEAAAKAAREGPAVESEGAYRTYGTYKTTRTYKPHETTEPPEPASDQPDWMRLLGQRTFGADAPAAIDLAERVTALAALPRRIAAAADDADETSALIEALTPLLPLLGMRYAGALPDIPERWGEAFLEARKPLARWLEEALDIRVIAPARADRFDAATMEAAETRRTVHAAENDTVMRVDRVGLARRGEALVRAIVVRYAAEGAAQS